MLPPTEENPSLYLFNGVVRVSRGYEAFHLEKQSFSFVVSHDGPLVEIKSPHERQLFVFAAIPDLVEALTLCGKEPVAEPGKHDEEPAKMGFQLANQ